MASLSAGWQAPGLRPGLWLGQSCPPAKSGQAGKKDNTGEKMSGNNDWFQSSRVPSFAQMLKKNLPVQPSAQTVTTPTGYSSESYSLSNMASKVTQVTGTNSFTFVIMPKFCKILGCPVSFDELPVSLFPEYISIYLWPCPN